MQYAKRQHFAKQDLSTITRASYIHHAWATNELTGCLTPSEISEFNHVIGQMKAGTYDPIPLNDGRYLIEVGEYMNGDRVTYILTDGVWQGQSIEWVGKIVTNSIRLTKTIKEYVNELSKTLGCEAVALALDAYAAVGVDEGFQEFTLERAVSYEEFDKQRAARQDNIGNTKIQYSRKRNVGEIESNGIKPSRKLNSELARAYGEKTHGSGVDLSENLDERGRGLYNENRIRYSKRAKYIPYDKIGAANITFLRSELRKLYSGINDGVADSIAIAQGSTVYIVDSGKDNGEISFGVRRKKVVSDEINRTKFIRRTNYDAVRKGHVSDGLLGKLGAQLDNDSGRDLRRESGTELPTDQRKSQYHERGVPNGDADRGGIKQSRKLNSELARAYGEIHVSEKGKNVRRLANPKSVDNLTEEQYMKAAKGLTNNSNSGTMSSGAITGAYNNKNDPEGIMRKAHAEKYYSSMRNSEKDSIVFAIAKNANVDTKSVSKMYDHLLINKYHLDKGLANFDEDYDIAESLRRLREGKDIQAHDLLLVKHEALEYDLMNEEGLPYEEAHAIANKSFDYQTALEKWLDEIKG